MVHIDIDAARGGVNEIIPISVCARRMADRTDIKSMYAKQTTWDYLPKIMTDITWGAMQFRDDHRTIRNFSVSRIIGFDFDNGLQNLAGIIDLLDTAEVPSHVGITKSHQKPKGPDGLVTDRFRVAMLMESCISDPDLYRQQLNYFRKIWSTGPHCWFDVACVDPARLFYPCTEIVYSRSGVPLPWVEKAKPKPTPKPIEPTGDFRNVPSWVYRRVKFSNDGRSRHSVAYSASAVLAAHGFGLEEITEFLMSGYLGESKPIGIGEYDVRECAYNGFSREKGGYSRSEAVDFASAGGRLRKGGSQ